MVLHEGKLAQEFGVSRTPIRQVLQRLAFEGLLETRSGVGTIASPLEPSQRDQHFSVLAEMFRLGTGFCVPSFDISSRSQIATIVELSRVANDNPLFTYFYIRSEILILISALVCDPIVADALTAMVWRALRWRMSWAREDFAATFLALQALVNEVKAADSPPQLLLRLADEPWPHGARK